MTPAVSELEEVIRRRLRWERRQFARLRYDQRYRELVGVPCIDETATRPLSEFTWWTWFNRRSALRRWAVSQVCTWPILVELCKICTQRMQALESDTAH